MSKKRDIIKSMIADHTYGAAADCAMDYINDLLPKVAHLEYQNALLRYQNALLRGQLSTATGIQDHMDPEESDDGK